MIATPDEILSFWLGDPGTPPLANAAKWFKKDDALDETLRVRFEETLAAAKNGACDTWKATARGRLALIVLFDQFSRNIYRGKSASFEQDGSALALSLEALERGVDRELLPIERYFLLMPLMHAESAEVQKRSVAEFERLRGAATPGLEKVLDDALDYARRHAAIISRFGRYPHRNAILGRASSPEELSFLAEPGSSF